MKRHMISLFLILALTASVLSGCGKTEESVSVQSVSMLMGLGSVGTVNRFSGVVAAGKTETIDLDDSMTLDEIKVEVGQEVKEGDLLFTYDNASLLLTIEQQKLEIEELQNSLTTKNDQITDLEKQRDSVSESNKLAYTLQIESLQADIRETEYNIQTKQKDLEAKQADAEKTEVYATVAGRVTEINEDGGTDSSGNAKAFMTIINTGNLRIKGTINEMNASSLQEGTCVIIRSRTTEETWTGTVSLIDWDNPVSGSSSYYYYGTDEMSSSSKYPFYVELDDEEGLFIGQHVYIEPGTAEQEGTEIRLASYFVVTEGDSPFVWAEDSSGKLEKRSVTLGNYDEAMDEYVIENGLALTDYVAFPDDSLKVGMTVVEYDETSFDYDFDDGGITEDEGIIEDDGIMYEESISEE